MRGLKPGGVAVDPDIRWLAGLLIVMATGVALATVYFFRIGPYCDAPWPRFLHRVAHRFGWNWVAFESWAEDGRHVVGSRCVGCGKVTRHHTFDGN
jgi:hypothetical protein